VVFDPGPLSVGVCSAPLWIHRSNGATSGRLDDRPLRPFLLIGLATNYLGFFTKIPILLNPQAAKPLDLHRFWDGVITSSQNLTRLRNEATALRNRQEFRRGQLTELANIDFEAWAKES
jgi:hypothetical protein